VIVEADEGCMAYVIATDIDNGSIDPDGDPVTIEISPVGPYSLGETIVTLTVTDDKGASDSCEATIMVVDTTPPVITCPDDVTVETESPLGIAVPLQATATDNCTSDPVIFSDELSIYPLGVTVVTFTATDDSGNTASCTMTVTVLLQVAIDIKPGSCPNAFNGKAKGVVPVAIVGTELFDVIDIDPETVTLEGVSPVDWSYDDTTQPVEGDASCENCFNADGYLSDTDGDQIPDTYLGDGYIDLILHFDTRALAAAVAGPGRDDCFEPLLVGETFGGFLIQGSDFMIMKTK